MPWPFFIPEFLKRRACRYLLHYYLGQYLEGKISLDDLKIDLYNGTGSVDNVPLNVETINEALDEARAPVQVVSGFIGRINVSIPWSSLMSSSCKVEISGLNITVMPSASRYGGQVSMTDSLFCSMSRSRQLAEEVLKTPPSTGEEEEAEEDQEQSGFEGMEALSKAIETILLRVQVTLVDTVVNVFQQTRSGGGGVGLELSVHVSRIEFFDEITEAEQKENRSNETSGGEGNLQLPEVGDFATKVLHLSGLTIELNTKEERETVNGPAGEAPCNYGVPIACVNGELNVRVRIKQNDRVTGSKLDIQVMLDAVHMLIYPQQLHSLMELINGITNEVQKSTKTQSSPNRIPQPHSRPFQSQSHPSSAPGHNRPIHQRDMRTIETQLMHHINAQRKKKKEEEELLQLDPWDISARKKLNNMSESVYSTGSDMFYSFNLREGEEGDGQDSVQVSHTSRGVTSRYSDIHMGEGVGLEQLVSPPQTQHQSRLQDSLNHAKAQSTVNNQNSTNEDTCTYSITIGGITVAILESKPVHTHVGKTSNRATGESDASGSETDSYSSAKADAEFSAVESLCSLDGGGLDPFKYFDSIKDILRGRVCRKEIRNCEKQIGQVLPADHLFLWMSTVGFHVTVEGSSSELSLTVASAELLEYLFDNEANLPLTTPVSIQPLAQFLYLEEPINHKPCVSITVSSKVSTATQSTTTKSSPFQKLHQDSNLPLTDIEVSLTRLYLHLDVMIIDRLHPLFHPRTTHHTPTHPASLGPPTVGTALFYPTVNTGIHGSQKKFSSQVLFSEAMSSDDSVSVQKVSIKLKSGSVHVSMRFPVADLSQSVRPPWYRPPLRKEVLFLDLTELLVSSSITLPLVAQRTDKSLTAMFKTVKAYFSLDGSKENRTLFAIIQSDSSQPNDSVKPESVDVPCFKLTYQTFEDSPLDHVHSGGHGLETDSGDEEMGFDMGVAKVGPSPFSQRRDKVLFDCSDKVRTTNSSRNQHTSPLEDYSSKQLVLPASQDEMNNYESHLSSTSHYTLSISLPTINIHIPSKEFLEALYNRVAVDLALWQPASPAAVEKATARSVFYSSADILQPALTKDDKFKLCKSVLRENSEEEESHNDDFKISSLVSPTHSDPPKAPTLLMTSLTVDRGNISLALPVKTKGVPSSSEAPSSDPRLLDLSPRRSQSPSNMSSAYPFEEGLLLVDLRGWHVCAGVNYEGEEERTQLCCKIDRLAIKHCGSVPLPLSQLVNPSTLTLDTDPLDTLLRDVLDPWDHRGSSRDPVLSIAMDSRTEKDINRRVHKLAVQLSDALFNYLPCLPQHTYFQQCATLFTFNEEAVPGYEPPTVITELYIHLNHSGLQYRPLYLGSHGVLTFDAISVSSTLVTDSPLLVTEILVDQMALFIADKQYKEVQLKKDFVCVLEMNIFQLVLRLCNKTGMSDEESKMFSKIPEVDLQCSGSELHFMFCVDSCSLLRDLIVYLAQDGDLKQRDTASDHTHPQLHLPNSHEGGEIPLQPHPFTSKTPTMVSSTINDLISEAMDEDNGKDNERVMRGSKTVLTDSRTSTSSTASSVSGHSMSHFSVKGDGEVGSAVPHMATTTLIFSSDSETEDSGPIKRPQNREREMDRKMKQKIAEEWEIDEDDYCVLTSPTSTKVGPGAEPVVKCFVEDGKTLEFIENYYNVPDEQMDQLKPPKHFPSPSIIYSLRELTIVWHLYGGRDFSGHPLQSSHSSSSVHKKHKMAATASEEQVSFHKRGGVQNGWRRKGGSGRDFDVLMEIELSRMRVQYESYPEGVEQSSRFVFLVRDLEIRDRLAVSRINKFLYHFSTETRPRQSHANMISFKVLFSHPESSLKTDSHSALDSPQSLEASVQISLLPIRLNIDQDAIFFLYDFFDQLLPQESSSTSSNDPSKFHSADFEPSSTQLHNDSSKPASSERPPLDQTPPTIRSPIYVKSFVFYPDVPIRIDYEAKRFHSKQLGTLASMLLGLSHLDNSEVTLKSLTYKNGILGWNHLFDQVTSEWIQDIQRYQLPRILQGVGPVYHVTQLFQGALDLFWLPIQQYQEDGRIVWGIQRGANSFVSSSGVAVVELSNRVLESVESVARTAFELVSTRERRQATNQSLETPPTHQPADLREGITNAYNVVSTGIGDTAWDLYDAAATEHSEYGVTGAVGGVLKNIPGTIVRPIIFMSEATRHVLGGMKNQFVPEARKEANEKWKNN